MVRAVSLACTVLGKKIVFDKLQERVSAVESHKTMHARAVAC